MCSRDDSRAGCVCWPTVLSPRLLNPTCDAPRCQGIEHRMFCHVTENWRGRPLVSQAVIVNLIGHTTTQTGLTSNAEHL